jgi:peptidoglycan hydrolase-like protein with peptidoglycan-binding domain
MQRGTRITTAVITAVLVVLMGTGAAFGVFALSDLGDQAAAERRTPEVTASAGPRTAPETAHPRTLEPSPEPEPLLEHGDRGPKVRELQHRLFQLAWFAPPMTGTFDEATRAAVKGFQTKRGFPASGEVDARTWKRVVRMSRMPTGDEMFNRAGPALFGPGDTGPQVREIQARLRQIAWFFGDVSDVYGDQTTAAVEGFQAKRTIPVTGEVDQRTLDLLAGMTSEPTADELANRPPDPAEGAPLDPRCLTGRAMCVDKSSNSLRWVVDGDVQMAVDVRFGREGMETREGQFAVSFKSRDHVSSIYDTPMPFAMFFSGGQAVHYSPDFAANGYNGASHGCVNVRDYDAIVSLFDQVQVGDKVVVYWS